MNHNQIKERVMKKRSIIAIFATLVLLSTVAFAQDEKTVQKAPYVTDFEKAKEMASAGDKPIIIDFFTDWCSVCKKFDREVLTDSKAIDYFTNDVVMAKINAEVDTVLAKAFGVIGYPTFVLTSSSGEEIDRVPGFLPIDEFIKTMADYQNGIGVLGVVLAEAQESDDRALYLQLANKYKYRDESKNAKVWFDKVTATAEKDSLSGEAYMSFADLLSRKDKDAEAMAIYKQVVSDFADTDFEARGQLYVGHMHRRAKEFEKALEMYNGVMAKFKGLEFEEEAEIYRAISYRDKGDTAQAITAYAGFVEHWPESEDVEYANKQIGKLRGE
jgi:thioredoxin-related protein/predicted negative regulator of RcsB-dependent stress response